MRNKQTGVSISGLIVVLVILAVLALFGFKVGPAVAEFFTAKNIIKTIAQEKRGGSVAEIRKAWDTRTMIDEVKVISSNDLEVTKDGGDVVERKSRRGKVFFGCANYPDCDFVLWNRPILEPCPTCGEKFLVEKITKRHGRQLMCHKEDCDYVRSEELVTADA